jgi:hypothetical protein
LQKINQKLKLKPQVSKAIDAVTTGVTERHDHLQELDTYNPELIAIFAKISEIPFPGKYVPNDYELQFVNLKKLVNKHQIREYLIQRYHVPELADKIVNEFNFEVNPVSLKGYSIAIEKFLKKSFEEKLKLAFDIYDFN